MVIEKRKEKCDVCSFSSSLTDINTIHNLICLFTDMKSLILFPNKRPHHLNSTTVLFYCSLTHSRNAHQLAQELVCVKYKNLRWNLECINGNF